MKFTIEFNHQELKSVIMNNTLLAIVESIQNAEKEVATAASIINKNQTPVEVSSKVQEQVPLENIPVQQAPINQVQITTVQPEVPTSPAATLQPIVPNVIPNTAVPIAAPSYSLDQIAVAATQLVDAGRRTELVSLLNSFGVQALTALPKEQYGVFATQLRTMGAKL